MAIFLRHRGRAIVAIALMSAALGLAVLTRGACSVLEARRRADLEEMVQFRQRACDCESVECARGVARLPAFTEEAMTEEAEDVQIAGWICLSRFSHTCTLRDLLRP